MHFVFFPGRLYRRASLASETTSHLPFHETACCFRPNRFCAVVCICLASATKGCNISIEADHNTTATQMDDSIGGDSDVTPAPAKTSDSHALSI